MTLLCRVASALALASVLGIAPAQPPVQPPAQPAGHDQPADPAAAPRQPGDAAPATIDITHRFARGDRLDLVYRKSVSSNRQPRAQQSLADIAVEILDRLEDGTVVVAWTQTLPPAPDNAGPTAAAITAAMNGLRLEFPLSPEGEIGELLNYPDIKQRIDAMIDAALQGAAARGTPPESIEAVRRMVAEMYADAERATAALTAEPAQYFGLYGWELSPDEDRVEPSYVVIPTTGTPVEGSVRVRVTKVNAAETSVSLEAAQTVDPGVLRAAIVESMAEMGERLGKPLDDQQRDQLMGGEFSYDQSSRARYNRQSGVLERVTVDRKVRTPGGWQNETLDFKLARIDPGAPRAAPDPAGSAAGP